LSRHCQLLHDAGTPFPAVLNEVQWLVMQLSREKIQIWIRADLPRRALNCGP
jgi:hypothetical protein